MCKATCDNMTCKSNVLCGWQLMVGTRVGVTTRCHRAPTSRWRIMRARPRAYQPRYSTPILVSGSRTTSPFGTSVLGCWLYISVSTHSDFRLTLHPSSASLSSRDMTCTYEYINCKQSSTLLAESTPVLSHSPANLQV